MFAFKEKHLPHYTYPDYVLWEGNWELINGVPYAMSPMPSWRHQSLNGNIFAELKDHLKQCGNCKANIPVDWKISEDTVLQPDVVVVCKPFEEGIFLSKTPEIIFEILSPSTASKDQNLKYELYEKAGVKYYIIVNPNKNTAQVFVLNADIYKEAGTYTSGKFHFEITGCAFDFDFTGIWE